MIASPSASRAEQLAEANHALAECLGREPLALASAADARASDGLLVCGVVGAKDVGKTTLIQSLARVGAPAAKPPMDEGTSRIAAFVHGDHREALESRLAHAGVEADQIGRVVTHRHDAVARVALLDLPDFSSTLPGRLELVRRTLPALDRVLWVWDPALAGDRAYLERVGRVVRHATNIVLILNKADLLLRDELDATANADTLWSSWRDWFADHVAPVASAGAPVFLIAAGAGDEDAFIGAVRSHWGDAEWDRAEDGERGLIRSIGRLASNELTRLSELLVRPIDEAGVARSQRANHDAVVEDDAARLRAHFRTDRLAALADGAAGVVDEEVSKAFTPDLTRRLARRIARRGRSDTALADEVLSRRLASWPLLPAVYWLTSGVIRWVGRLAGELAGQDRDSAMTRVDGVELSDRIEGVAARVRARLAELSAVLRRAPELHDTSVLAKRAESRFHELTLEADDAVTDACVHASRGPGLIGRAFVYMVLLWFPFIQPISRGVLEGLSAEGPFDLLRGATVLVTALGAGAILRGLLVSLLVFALLLGAMYSRSVRDVRRARAATDVSRRRSDRELSGLLHDQVADVVESAIARPLRESVEHPAGALRRLTQTIGQAPADSKQVVNGTR